MRLEQLKTANTCSSLAQKIPPSCKRDMDQAPKTGLLLNRWSRMLEARRWRGEATICLTKGHQRKRRESIGGTYNKPQQ